MKSWEKQLIAVREPTLQKIQADQDIHNDSQLDSIFQLIVRHIFEWNATSDILRERIAILEPESESRFQAVMGVDIYSYIYERRFETAIKLIEQAPNHTLQNILRGVGIRSTSGFSEEFKRRYQMSCTEYSRRSRRLRRVKESLQERVDEVLSREERSWGSMRVLARSVMHNVKPERFDESLQAAAEFLLTQLRKDEVSMDDVFGTVRQLQAAGFDPIERFREALRPRND